MVGRPAPRVDGLARARGEAPFTADIRLPGMLHTAVLRSPHPRARARRVDLSAALEAPGVRAAIGPGDIPALSADCDYEGAAVAAVCADTFEQAQTALRHDRGRVGGARAAARRRRGRRPRRAARRPQDRPRRPRPRARRGRRGGRGHLPHAGRAPQLDGDPPVDLPLGGRHARGLHLDAVHLGRPLRPRSGARDRPRPDPRRLRLHGRRLRLEERPGRPLLHRRRAGAPHRPARPLRADPARGARRGRQPRRHDPAARRRRPRRRNADRARRRVRERGRLVGMERVRRGPDADRCTGARTSARRRAARSSTCRR